VRSLASAAAGFVDGAAGAGGAGRTAA